MDQTIRLSLLHRWYVPSWWILRGTINRKDSLVDFPCFGDNLELLLPKSCDVIGNRSTFGLQCALSLPIGRGSQVSVQFDQLLLERCLCRRNCLQKAVEHKQVIVRLFDAFLGWLYVHLDLYMYIYQL